MCATPIKQIALAALVEEKREVEARAAKFAMAAEDTCIKLEEKLHEALEAADFAEARAETLRVRLENCRNADKMVPATEIISKHENFDHGSGGRETATALGAAQHIAVDILSERTMNQIYSRVDVGDEDGPRYNAESTAW